MSQLKERSSQPGSWEEFVSFCVGLKPGGLKRTAGTSRMSREVHVRIWGAADKAAILRVKVPPCQLPDSDM
jgi:hypothetical protein